MSPSRWSRMIGSPLLAAAVLLSLTAQGSARIDRAAAVMVAPASTPKSCSGAFRYAARVGNSDIVEVSPVQAFARDRRLSRIRYTARGMYNFEAGIAPLQLLTAMCGAR